jgi:HK97 family phage portal protein
VIGNPLRALFDRRSDAIGSAFELAQYLLGRTQSKSGVAVNETSAMNVAVVRQCVALVSRTVMTLPLAMFETIENGRRPAPEHPLQRLFDKPNGWQDWPMFVQMLMVHLLLRANSYTWINWVRIGERFQAMELIPMHPDRMRVKQLPDWSLEYTLIRTNGSELKIPADEVMHLRGLSTDGYMGRDPLTDMKESIGDSLATQEYSSKLWRNDAMPNVALSHPGKLSQKAKDGIETSWEKTYGGKDGRRVAVLEEGMKLETVSLNAKQSEFLGTRKFLRSEIAGEFFVPPHMIGDTEKSTSWGTGIEQQKLGYLTFTIQPWLTVLEAGIKRCLITNEGRFYAKFKVEGLLRGDSAARADFYERMWRMGAYTINQILALEDMNPVEGGDVRFVPLNFVPLDRAIKGDVSEEQRQASAAMLLTDVLDALRKQAGKAAA